MITAFDVYYVNDTATTACVCFDNWTDSISKLDLIEFSNRIEPYKSGEFYKRELPCIISLIEKHKLQPSVIIVDGYVWLNENKIGLGGHLFNELNGQIPVIGVAKSKFAIHSKVTKLLRGNSQSPLYISSIGIGLNEAAQNIEKMDGNFRLPTLLKRVDQLCRGIL